MLVRPKPPDQQRLSRASRILIRQTASGSDIFSYLKVHDKHSISKRAARRLIQQATVLTGRDRSVRHHIRGARLATLWVLADWNFEWTVNLDRGKVRFERRPARQPDLTLTWPEAEVFFNSVQEGKAPDIDLEAHSDLRLRQYIEPLYRSFCRSLEQVMKYPFDDAGNPLM